jgi:serine/threonine protein kinase
MIPEGPRQVRTIVAEALKIPKERRPAFLNDACGADAALRAEVEDLLAFEERDRAEDLPRGPLPETGPDLSPDNSDLEHAVSTTDESTSQDEDSVRSVASVPARRFRVERFHAQGGLGRVSIAFDRQLGRHVALKEVRPDRLSDQARQRFLVEAEITGQLEHPGIAPVYALEEDADGDPYYVMRFVEGRTLAEAIKDHHEKPTPLAFRDLLRRFVTVCQTIAYAHSKGVIHRDLKPMNILLGDYDETLVLDWGLAKRVSEAPPAAAEDGKQLEDAGSTDAEVERPRDEEALTAEGQVLGTPAYMSPEQAHGRIDRIGPPTDVYALGAILYELLTGRAPFVGSKGRDLLRQLQDGPPPSPRKLRRELPRALEGVCLKAMARAIPERYPGAAELADDVNRWLADEPVTACREPWTDRTRRWARRHRVTVTAAAVAFVLLLIGAAIGATLQAKANERLAIANLGEQTARAERSRAEARSAGQQGDWKAALAKLDEALELDHPDPIGIRLERIKALAALAEVDQSREEIARLAEEKDLGSHAAEVDLLRADSLLLQQEEQEAVALLHKALEGNLPPADAAYARALLANQIGEIAQHLTQCVALDPLHLQGQQLLSTTLILQGDLDKASQQLAAASILFPNDASFVYFRALIETWKKAPGSARKILVDASGRINAQQAERMKPIVVELARLADILDIMDWWDDPEGGPEEAIRRTGRSRAVLEMLSGVLGAKDAPAAARAQEAGALFRVPRAFQNVLKGKGAAGGDPTAALSFLAKLAPDGMYHFVRGNVLLTSDADPEEVSRAFAEAVATPSVVPNVGREALYCLAMSEGLCYLKDKNKETLERAVAALRRRLALGPLKPPHAGNLFPITRRAGALDLGRVIAQGQLQQFPDNMQWLLELALIELWGGNYQRALELARKGLAKQPNDLTAWRYQAEACLGLAEQIRKRPVPDPESVLLALGGDVELALTDAKARVKDSRAKLPDNQLGLEFYHAAYVHSLASAAVTNNPRQAEQYANEAMALLRLAVAALGGSRELQHLQRDRSLNPLRGRADFKELIGRLEERVIRSR